MDDAGFEAIRGEESFRGEVYLDQGGFPTIGYGHLILPGEDFSAGITRAEGEALFRADVERVVNPSLDLITADLNQNQVNALGSFIFNVGGTAFQQNVLPRINAGNNERAMLSVGRHTNVRVNGRLQFSRGLDVRRRREIELFNTPGNGND